MNEQTRKTRKILISLCCLAAAPLLLGFTDLPDEHWATPSVNQLVSDGTVNGYGDDTFQPNKAVTRAEFVKMLGVQTNVRTAPLPDLKLSHWAFSLLMHSPLRTVDGNILPDAPITRAQVAEYLYDCYAGGAESFAPSVITDNAGDSKTEVGWAYEHAIMVGDDGLSLRLNDPLTRAEAAVLIVNSRNKLETTTDFADVVSDDTLRRVFESSGLFDAPYNPDQTLTNGEAARAAYRLMLDRIQGLYYYDDEPGFEHEYANDLKAFEPVLGAGRISAAYADQPAMPEDAFGMLAFAMVSKSRTPTNYGAEGPTYADANPAAVSLQAPLRFAYMNGIRPFAGGRLKSGTPVTHKSMAAALLQYDLRWGVQSSVTITAEGASYQDEKMRYDNLPETAELYPGILQSVPNAVYNAPFRLSEGATAESAAPKGGYSFYEYLRDSFAGELEERRAALAEQGAEVEFTYYPQLTYDAGDRFAMRVKAEIKSGQNAGELFADAVYADGNTAWVDFPVSYSFFME